MRYRCDFLKLETYALLDKAFGVDNAPWKLGWHLIHVPWNYYNQSDCLYKNQDISSNIWITAHNNIFYYNQLTHSKASVPDNFNMQLSVMIMAALVALGVAHPGQNWLVDRKDACPGNFQCNTSDPDSECCWIGSTGCYFECREGSDSECFAEVCSATSLEWPNLLLTRSRLPSKPCKNPH